MSGKRSEPRPQTMIELVALSVFCSTCFADEGSWCASVAARDDYCVSLHASRLAAASSGVQQEGAET